MKTSPQYRELAADCLRLAEKAKTDDERRILREMAATWQKLAGDADQQGLKV
jgi:hypothetical protein